jgi:predicted amidohydrolase YtcJ
MSGASFAPAEAVTVEQAFALYTRNAAFAAFDENKKGTVTPGKYADFVVLGSDPRSVAADTIADIPIAATIQGGDFVYEAPMV